MVVIVIAESDDSHRIDFNCADGIPQPRLADGFDHKEGIEGDPGRAPHVVVADGRIDHPVRAERVDQASDGWSEKGRQIR